MRSISKKLIVLLFVLTSLQASIIDDMSILMAVKPTNNQVVKILQKKVSLKYKGLFRVENFKRKNGYWVDKNNGRYKVKISYNLIANEDIQPKEYLGNPILFGRLKLLKFYHEIEENEVFKKKESLKLQFTEYGWELSNSYLGF